MTTTPAPTAVRPTSPTDAPAPRPGTRGRRMRRLAVHYVEMVIAMAVGMVALHPVWTVAFDGLGWSAVLDRPEPMALVMATNMTVAMSAWMKIRGHGWRSIAEMGAAMYLPFVVLFGPLWAGVLTADAMLQWGHVLMLFAMAGAMAIRPQEYAHC